MNNESHVLITGGAGYIGSFLTGHLLRLGFRVTVVDDLLFGGESLLAYFPFPTFHFTTANLILKRVPETVVIHKDLTFGGDMRDICVSFQKVHSKLGFETHLTVEDGVREVLNALRFGIISDPQDQRYRNAQFIVQ